MILDLAGLHVYSQKNQPEDVVCTDDVCGCGTGCSVVGLEKIAHAFSCTLPLFNLCVRLFLYQDFTESLLLSYGRRNVSAAKWGYPHPFTLRWKKSCQLKSSAAMSLNDRMPITCSKLNLVKSTGFMTCS